MNFDQLLKSAQKTAPTYSSGLANHLPMVLIAMHRMDISVFCMRTFYNRYSEKLERVQPDQRRLDGDWTRFLGNHDCYYAYLQYFRMQLQKQGMAKVLRSTLQTLVPGICASAFHCMIRLGYAIQQKNSDEIAISLAYWAAEYQTLGPIEFRSGAPAEMQALQQRILQVDGLSNQKIKASNIILRLGKVGNLPEFARLNHWLGSDIFSLDDIAAWCLALYAAGEDFTALHCVTSCHAFRLMAPYFANSKMALNFYVQALCAVFVSIGTPETGKTPDLSNDLTWPQIIERVSRSKDDHEIKMVYTCREEERFYRRPEYRIVAAKSLKC